MLAFYHPPLCLLNLTWSFSRLAHAGGMLLLDYYQDTMKRLSKQLELRRTTSLGTYSTIFYLLGWQWFSNYSLLLLDVMLYRRYSSCKTNFRYEHHNFFGFLVQISILAYFHSETQ